MEDAAQNPSGCCLRLFTGGCVRALQARFGELEVPIAEGAPYELVEPVRRVVEAIGIECCRDLCGASSSCSRDPAVHSQLATSWRKVGNERAIVHLYIARRVPQ